VSNNNYSTAYISWCHEISKYFQDHLHRELTPQERRWCENIGSLMMLESVDRKVTTIQEEAALEHYLQGMAAWTEKRFLKALETFCSRLANLMQRELSATERQALQQQGTVSRLLQFDEQLADISSDQQPQFAEHWLATLR